MKRRLLGRTGLQASVIGLGCGGHSRLGQARGLTERASIRLVKTALEEDINFFDTARAYGTEPILGKALETVNREEYILSSKVGLPSKSWFGFFRNKRRFEAELHRSLRALKTDYIDIFSLHCVRIENYPEAHEYFAELMMRFRDQGKIRFLGVTEFWVKDPTHRMFNQAVQDDCWDVIMVGLNFVNQTALKSVIPKAVEKNLGIQIMFGVRRGLSNATRVRNLVQSLVSQGVVDPARLDTGEDPLGFLLRSDVSRSYADAAYRFCTHAPGAQVVLSGTGDVDHLRSNVASINGPSLPEEVVQRLRAIFQEVSFETCN